MVCCLLVEHEGVEPSSYKLHIRELYMLFNLKSFLLRVDRLVKTIYHSVLLSINREKVGLPSPCVATSSISRAPSTLGPRTASLSFPSDFCTFLFPSKCCSESGLGSHPHRSIVNFCIYCLYVFPHCLCMFPYLIICNQIP